MTKIDAWGNSLAVRIPKNLAESAKLRKGTEVVFKAVNEGILIARSPTSPRSRVKRKYTLRQLLARCKGSNPYKFVGDDIPVGKEKF